MTPLFSMPCRQDFPSGLVFTFSRYPAHLLFRGVCVRRLFFASILDTAALGQSGADAKLGQDEFLQGDPEKDNNGQNQNVFHEIFFPIRVKFSGKQYNFEYRSGMRCYL